MLYWAAKLEKWILKQWNFDVYSFTWRKEYYFLIDFSYLQQDSLRGGKWSNGTEMTEEEALAEQQRMFAEARARMNGGAIASKQPDADQNLES